MAEYIQSAIMKRMLAFSGLTDLVSARIYGGYAPQNPNYPLIILSLIVTVPTESSTEPAGLAKSLLQLDIYAPTKSVAVAISQQASLCLHAWQGDIYDDMQVYHVMRKSDVDAPRDPDGRLQRITQQYEAWHTEPTS